MPDYEDYESSKNDTSDVVAAIERVEEAVARVERAVKDSWSTGSIIGAIFGAVVLFFLFEWVDKVGHGKWRYKLQYSSVSSEKVFVEPRPHDCDFLAAPLGIKYCHYEREVSTVRWATSAGELPLISLDEGRTWQVRQGDNVKVPRGVIMIQEVHISWEKVDE
jgi:hypothetical protein